MCANRVGLCHDSRGAGSGVAGAKSARVTRGWAIKYQCGDACMHRTNVGLARRWEAVAGGIGDRGGAPSRDR